MAGFGGAVKLKGESEYRKALEQIKRNLNEVTSEMKAVSASYDKNDKSADAVTKQTESLNKVMEVQQKKLETLKSEYSSMSGQYSEQTKKHEQLVKSYNDEKDKLEILGRTVGTTSQEYKDQQAKVEQLASEVQKSSKAQDANEKSMSKMRVEINKAQEACNKTEKEMKNLAESTEDAGEEAKDTKGGYTMLKDVLSDLASEGIQRCVDALKDFIADSGEAYSKFQAQTGASTEEMAEFKEEIDDLYKNNYGESLGDIGDKMAYIKQVTGETDPSKIRELAENAIALEDTFGSDFNETVRGVSNLMTHFGIDSQTAFDLFAQGSQNGLDYTSELGDNIAEYGGNFALAGYSAEEYFQLLENGSKGGAYNLDKVNDSINEVKNRLGDGTIGKNIDEFSDSTKTAFEAWQNGQGTMKDVIDSIVGDISNCTSETDALTMAQIAFGTMGEDANLDVVKSLTTLGSSYDNVNGKMDELKEQRYDNVTSQFQQLGRTLKMDLLAPLAEKVLPVFKEFADTAIKNIDKIIPVVTTLGVALGGIFVTNKIATFVNSLKTLLPALGLVKVATDAETASTIALNTAWLANPITWIVAGIASLIAVMVVLKKKQDEAIEAEYGLSEAQKESIEQSKELAQTYNDLNKAREDATNGVIAEYSYIDELKNEYNGLIDSNGKVKKGYEDRANFILDTLAKSLGVERSEIEQLIGANGKLGKSIDTIIEKKKAEAVLNANEQAYTEAIKNRQDALNKYMDAVKTADEAEAKYNETKDEASRVMEIYNTMVESGAQGADAYYSANRKLIEANEKAKESYEEAKEGLDSAESAYVGYNATIKNYEGLSSAVISGDTKKIGTALQNMENNFITAENGTKTSLENQVKNMQENYEYLKEAIEQGAPNVTQEMVDQAKDMVDKSTAELDKYQSKAKESTSKAGDEAVKGFESKKGNAKKAGDTVGKNAVEGVKSGSKDMSKTGKNAGTDYVDSVKNQKEKAKRAGDMVGSSSVSGAKSGSNQMSSTGKKAGENYTSGVSSKNSDAKSKGKSLATSAKDGAGSVKTKQTGKDFSQGFIDGIGSLVSDAVSKAKELGSKALSAVKRAIKSNSPSKATRELGGFFSEGFAIGIEDEANEAINASKGLGTSALKSLSGLAKEMSQLGQEGGQGFSDALNSNIGISTNGLSSQLKSAGGLGYNPSTSGSVEETEMKYDNIVNAFKDALSQMKVELDDDEVGTFIDKTVTRLVYN